MSCTTPAAADLKERGNTALKDGHLSAAMEYYDGALDQLRLDKRRLVVVAAAYSRATTQSPVRAHSCRGGSGCGVGNNKAGAANDDNDVADCDDDHAGDGDAGHSDDDPDDGGRGDSTGTEPAPAAGRPSAMRPLSGCTTKLPLAIACALTRCLTGAVLFQGPPLQAPLSAICLTNKSLALLQAGKRSDSAAAARAAIEACPWYWKAYLRESKVEMKREPFCCCFDC
jgi:hypothetical protein